MLGFIVLILLTQDHTFLKTAHIYALQYITEPVFFLRYLTLKIRLIFTLNYACAHKRSTSAILYEIWHQQCLQSDEAISKMYLLMNEHHIRPGSVRADGQSEDSSLKKWLPQACKFN